MHISLIGNGNVAWHLAKAITAAGHSIDFIASRNPVIADPDKSDIYIIAVSDNAIGKVSDSLPQLRGIVVHTSGATPMSVLGKHEQHGVLYPCQTFSKGSVIDYTKLPFFIEGNTEQTAKTIAEFARTISSSVAMATSQQREHLHVAAVMASNFSNHLIMLAKEHLEKNEMDYTMLRPLVEQTIEKAFEMDPKDAQTGPARRNDEKTLEAHRKLIDDEKTLEIYNILTESIQRKYRQ